MNRSTRALLMAAVVLLAWASVVAAAEQSKNLLKAPNKAASWRFEQFEQGQGKMTEADAGAILLEVTHAGAQNWNVQAFLTQLDLKDGQEYTFAYKIKGDPARTIAAIACIDEDDWHSVGLQEDIELTKDWKEHTHTFKAENVAAGAKNRIGFMVGSATGKAWIKDVSRSIQRTLEGTGDIHQIRRGSVAIAGRWPASSAKGMTRDIGACGTCEYAIPRRPAGGAVSRVHGRADTI